VWLKIPLRKIKNFMIELSPIIRINIKLMLIYKLNLRRKLYMLIKEGDSKKRKLTKKKTPQNKMKSKKS